MVLIANTLAILIFLMFSDAGLYFLENAGTKPCRDGSRGVKNNAECASACAELGISSSEKPLWDGNACYKGGKTAVCRQDGNNGNGASLICKEIRNSIITYLNQDHNESSC